MTPEERDALLGSLNDAELAAAEHEWWVWARDAQVEPTSDWRTWLVLAGRGWGKTRTAVEWVRSVAERDARARIALVGATAADVRDVMVEGESGIVTMAPPWFRPKYEPSKRRLTWPNGALATTFSADEPDRMRGPQHSHAWCDELAAWKDPDGAWDMLMFGLRLGERPQCVVTTTPRPIKLIRRLLDDPTSQVARGSTYENKANLAKPFLDTIIKRYEGTTLGRQELHAEVLSDTPGALWRRAQLDALRTRLSPAFTRVVVSVDPSVADDGGGDECGIVVVATGLCACKGGERAEMHGFVIEDLSGHLSPDAWARRVVAGYRTQRADRIIAEANNGGALVTVNIRTVDPRAPVKTVHASRGKRARAEPIAALYEQGKVHHLGGFAKLEDEMTTWDASSGGPSPNRVDALVWGLTELMLPEEMRARGVVTAWGGGP